MSKKATTKRVAQAARVTKRPVPVSVMPREAHSHMWCNVKISGARIRYGCGCGYWDIWTKMTDAENAAYRKTQPTQEETVEQHDDDAVLDLKVLLQQTQASAVADATGTALNHADQAGVRVIENVEPHEISIGYGMGNFGSPPAHGDTPAYRRTEISDTEAARMDATKRDTRPVRSAEVCRNCSKDLDACLCGPMSAVGIDDATLRPTWPVVYAPDGYLSGSMGSDLPDRDDDSDTAIVEDFESEDDGSGYADRDIVWLLWADGNLLEVLDRAAAQTEMERLAREGDTKIETGDAEYDPVKGDWFIPASVCKRLGFRYDEDELGYVKLTQAEKNGFTGEAEADVDDDTVAAFVAESFGDDDDEVGPPTKFDIELNFGNDNVETVFTNEVATFVNYLDKHKRNDLEFACRKLGLQVTTKTNKASLIEAIVILANTSTTSVDKVKCLASINMTVNASALPKDQVASTSPNESTDRFAIELTFGDGQSESYTTNDGVALVTVLALLRRGGLEIAARNLGIKGVTTDTLKAHLIRAIVVMADTTLQADHRANRAALMVRRAPLVDSDQEWAKHYGPTSN